MTLATRSEAAAKAASAREASRGMGAVTTDQKNDALERIAAALEAETARILAVNERELERGRERGLGEAFIETNELQEETVALPDFKEGIASFMERRPPNFPRVTVD